MDELNRTLESLEARFQSMSGNDARPVREARPVRRDHDDRDISQRMERLSQEASYRARDFQREPAREERRPSRPQRGRDTGSGGRVSPFQALARDFERAREQEEGVAAVSKIAGELRQLREELRHEMTTGLHREFEKLRRDIEEAYASARNGAYGFELKGELDRISDAIHDLAQRNDDNGIGELRHEIDDVKRAMETLLRDDAPRRAEPGFGDSGGAAPDPALDVLYERLEQIGNAVNMLPESLSLRTLEEKVRTLASALDQFSEQQKSVTPEAFRAIEERLDEISRAIVASSVTANEPHAFDPEPFERIEARMSSLAGQLEELGDDRPAIFESLSQLSERIDDIARRASEPNEAVDRLASQIASISDRIENDNRGLDTGMVLRELESRLEDLSDKLNQRQGDANDRNESLLRDLESQLASLSHRLDERGAETGGVDETLMDAINARFAEFERRLEDRSGQGDAEVVRALESRLEAISSRLESSTQQVAGIDPDLIRSLEEQVAGLSAHLSQPSQPLPEFEDIRPRLDSIEQSLTSGRGDVMEAARHAAEDVLRNMSSAGGDVSAVSALAEDLKSLDALARKTDEKNTRTFEAIHDTLLKIVDRLGALEQSRPEPSAGGRLALDEAPPVDPSLGSRSPAFDPAEDGVFETSVDAEARLAGSPADEADDETADKRRKSLLSGLSRALGSKKKDDDGSDAAAVEPAMAQAADQQTLKTEPKFDPEVANRPLEPGSGAPDLQAIMRRVREERNQPAKSGGTAASQSDFIAAARRAAQAAAAEAEILKKKSEKGGDKGGFQAREFLSQKRKPLLMAAAAIMIALAGLQLGKAFFTGGEEVASIEADPAPAAMQQEAEPAMATDMMAMDEPQEAMEEETPPAPPVRTVHASNGATPSSPAELASQSRDSETATPVVASRPMEEASDTATRMSDSAAMSSDTETAMESDGAFPAPPVEAGPVPLREAAAAGDPKAMFEIAARYAQGRGVNTDMAEAAKWYERSAELGFAPAQYRIGNLNEKGIGVERDIATAKKWYKMAAAQGNASAMHNLAVLYAMGADGTTDNQEAARWFIEAAEHGVKDSQFNLGILAAKGVGMPRSLEESYKWFALAAKGGDKDAAAKRDEVANAMSPQELAKAKAATELWKPKQVDIEANTVDIPDAWRESDARTASIDMGKAVTNIQIILNKNGYDAGPPDGIMGERTKNAIAEFQKANGMDPTGEVDEKLVRALLAKK